MFRGRKRRLLVGARDLQRPKRLRTESTCWRLTLTWSAFPPETDGAGPRLQFIQGREVQGIAEGESLMHRALAIDVARTTWARLWPTRAARRPATVGSDGRRLRPCSQRPLRDVRLL